MTSVFHINQDGTLAVMRETAYESEDLFQRLLEQHPEILAGEQFRGEEPRRWALVAREIDVPDGESGNKRWALDHLFLDQDGVPTLVEVKRRSDTRIRREVIGQMFDYAANGPSNWQIDELRSSFARTQQDRGRDPDAAFKVLVGDDSAPDEFWATVERNLRSGRIRMVFLVDEAPPELVRIIEFLGRQLRDAEVYLVEIRQHVGPSGRVLVTDVMGAVSKTSAARTGPKISEAEWIASLESKHGPKATDVALRLITWMKGHSSGTFLTASQSPSFGMYVTAAGRKQYPLFLTGNGKAAISVGYLESSPRFSSEASRQQIVDRVSSATGLDLSRTNLRGDIRIPLSELSDQKKYDGLVSSITWLVENLAAVSAQADS